MMNSMRLGLVFLCLSVLLLCQRVGFTSNELRTEIMSKGLKAESTEKLFVHVTLNQDAKSKSGLSKKLIQAQVEKQLRQNGITPIGETKSSYGLFVDVTETPARSAEGVIGFAFSTWLSSNALCITVSMDANMPLSETYGKGLASASILLVSSFR